MWIDLILLVLLVLSFSVGFSRGIIKTIFTLLSYAFGVMAALRFTPAVTNFLKTTFNEESPLMFLAGLVVTFGVTMLVIRMLAKGIEGMLKTANINIINQILGGALTAAVTVLLYSVVLSFILVSTYQDVQTATDGSRTYPYLKDYPDLVWDVADDLKPVLRDFWEYSVDVMDQMENMTERSETENYFYDIQDENGEEKGTARR